MKARRVIRAYRGTAAIPALLLMLMLALSCGRQANREIFEDLEGREGIYMIKVPPVLFLTMMQGGNGPDSLALGDIDFVKFLLFSPDQAPNSSSSDIMGSIREDFYRFGYETAVEFSSGGTFLSAWVLENKDYVSDIVILVKEGDGLVGLGLSGRLNGKAVASFASGIDYDSLRDMGNFTFLP